MAKYSPEMTAEICKHLRELKGRVGACKAVGISYQTFTRWLKEESEFNEAIRAAEGEMKQSVRQLLIARTIDHSKKYWQAGAFMLRSWFPEEFGEKTSEDSEEIKRIKGFVIQLAKTTKDRE